LRKNTVRKAEKIHVRKDDIVLVLTGKDAGKRGKVLMVDPRKGRVLVEDVAIVKRHTRPTRALPQGGINEKESPVASSNVMLICTKCKQPTRIGKTLVNDKQVRTCKRCKELID